MGLGASVMMPAVYRENIMISGYSDHAANERTFLAWIRTGIAVIAFGS